MVKVEQIDVLHDPLLRLDGSIVEELLSVFYQV